MDKQSLQLVVDTSKTILSSKSLFYKTENFINQTKYIANVDFFLSKLCETLLLNLSKVENGFGFTLDNVGCFEAVVPDKGVSILFRFGCQINSSLNKYDIVLINYSSNVESNNAEQISFDFSKNKKINVVLNSTKHLINQQDFNKLYVISNVSGVNLPKLTAEQKDIVETIDKNVLVQGVAGSGKTNICIDKIIFTACKNYSGKTLYTTFSRGLLSDIKLKIELYKQDLKSILNAHKNDELIFLDGNHKKALENKLGIYFFNDDDNEIFLKIASVLDYLDNKVEYCLIEDLYNKKFNVNLNFVNESYFVNSYIKNLSNHQIEKALNRVSKLSNEIIYKEIFGFIFGFYNLEEKPSIMLLNNYVLARQNSFSKQECEAIHQIAVDYKKHLEKHGLIDNNLASRQLIEKLKTFEYSLTIIDEVQDFTQVNLCLFKKLSLKLFCVGDALQMINPSYFNFGYLKNLLFEKDLTEVKELKHNYRNSAKIEEIVDALSLINKQEFGTHNFVLKGQSVDNGLKTTAVFVNDSNFINQIKSGGFDNCTFVVSNLKQKQELKKVLTSQEVLTVSEIKGLERNTVIAFNILTSNADKWELLNRNKVNHKLADENSVFRYYYNLFYVGLTRAKQNIFVVEEQIVNQFANFFKDNFENSNSRTAIQLLGKVASKIEFSQQELVDRVNEFIKLEQFDNARFATTKVKEEALRVNLINTINIYENYIHFGKYREAGIKFWECGLLKQAKEQFLLSGDTALVELIDSCEKNNGKNLNIDIVNYFCDVEGNKMAQSFILDTLKKDVRMLTESLKTTNQNFKKAGNNGGK